MEFVYACEEHIDEAMDEVINEKETGTGNSYDNDSQQCICRLWKY